MTSLEEMNLREANAELGDLRREVSALREVANAADALIHSIRAKLKHGRGSRYEIALGQALQDLKGMDGP